jgi:hypothetical protein
MWWLYFIITFLIPTFHFPGYSFKTPSPFVEKYGVSAFIGEVLIFKSLVPVILPQVAYTYVIISFAMPRYFFRRRKLAATTLAFVGMMAFVYAASVALMYVPFYRQYKLGLAAGLPGIVDAMHFVNKSYLLHFPIVAGFALIIKLTKRWWQKQKETEQLAREKASAELQLLKSTDSSALSVQYAEQHLLFYTDRFAPGACYDKKINRPASLHSLRM